MVGPTYAIALYQPGCGQQPWVALDWVSSSQDMSIDAYLAQHRYHADILGLKTYFNSVIDWIGSVFTRPPDKEMQGLEWGRLYGLYHQKPYNAAMIDAEVNKLRNDPGVGNNKGIYEYLLGGKAEPQLLAIRLFDDRTKTLAYQRQTDKAKADGTSNCPLCAIGSNANKTRIYRLRDMDADHVTAWSKGGSSELDNCEMLCVPHNRAKGNK